MLNTLHNSLSLIDWLSSISIGLVLLIGEWNVSVYMSRLESLTLLERCMNFNWNNLLCSTTLFKFSIDSS